MSATARVNRRETPASALVQPSSYRRWLGLGVAVGFVVVTWSIPSLDLDSYSQAVVYNIAFYAAVAQAWNLMSGFTGYISFAHGALAGVGSYGAILTMNAGGSFPVAVLAGAGAAIGASVLIGLPSLRLRGIAFAFATIFFQAAILIVANKAVPLTGGSRGLASNAILPLEDLLVAMLLVAGTATAAVYTVRRTRVGLRLLAIREDETAAKTLGIRTVRLKFAAFMSSAALAGAAGGVHGFYLATIFPANVFELQSSLEPLVIALIGGSASAGGPIVMAAIYGLSQEILQTLGSELQLSLLGLLLVLVVLFARNGLAGLVDSARDRMSGRRQDK